MLVTIVILVSTYYILPIMYFVMLGMLKNRKNLILGVTLPEDKKEEKEVTDICKDYKKSLNIATGILAVLPFLAFFSKWDSISITIILMWMFAIFIVLSLVYVKYYKKMKTLKYERGWESKKSKITFVDMKLATEKRKINTAAYVPAMVISMLPFIFELFHKQQMRIQFPFLIVTGTVGFTTILCLILSVMMSRMKAEVVSEDSAINSNLARIRTYNIDKCCIICAYINTAYTIFTWMFMLQENTDFKQYMYITITYSFAILFAIFSAYLDICKLRNKIMEGYSNELLEDDDEYWIYGAIYYNPNDTHSMVPQRMGIGSTMNMAKRSGKIVMGLSLLSLAIIPIVCVWMIFEEFTPISLYMQNNKITAKHLSIEYEVDLDKIQSLKLIKKQEFPDGGTRVFGTGFETLCKGLFKYKGIGYCDVCLNPQNGKFIIVKLKDKTYIFSGSTDEQTKEVYDKISLRFKENR